MEEQEQSSNAEITKGFGFIEIQRLVKADWNYKKDDDDKKKKLIANLKRNGQVENIIIRHLDTGFYEVVNGNHRLDAMQEIGMEKVFAFNMGDISLAHAERLAVETNETRFDNDAVKLAKLIKEVADEFGVEDIEVTMPYSAEEMQNMFNLLDFDWSGSDNPGTDSGPQGKTGFKCPECGHEGEEKEFKVKE